jgi:hypothetical protein
MVRSVPVAAGATTAFAGHAKHLERPFTRLGQAPDALWLGIFVTPTFDYTLVSVAR